MTLSRRTLLGHALGVTAASAMSSLGVFDHVLGPLAATRYAFADSGWAGDTIVVISMRGGFDGLSAVVPAADPHYYAARPSIGVPASKLLPLDNTFGLHPSLAPLHPWWSSSQLAVVHGVGQVNPTRSHFAAMAELERAAPGSTTRTGWVDRLVGVTGAGGPFGTVQLGRLAVDGALAGPNPTMSLSTIAETTLNGANDATERRRWSRTLRAMYADAPAAVSEAADTALTALATATRLAHDGYRPAHGASYPTSDLGTALRDTAHLIKAGVGLRVAFIDFGDCDFHSALGTLEEGLMLDYLDDVGKSLAAFATDLGAALGRVAVVTLSEFGRRVTENGNQGADHGHGNAMFALGGGVRGGQVWGDWPGLAPDRLDNGDLAGTTDYRTVLAELIEKRTGTSTGGVFPGLPTSRLGMFKPLS